MAQAKKIRVSLGHTRNMGNFESLRLEFSAEIEVLDGESATDLLHDTRQKLRKQLEIGIRDEIDHFHS